MKIGRLTISDRASAGLSKDRSGPEIERALRETFGASVEVLAVAPTFRAPRNDVQAFRLEAACQLFLGETETPPRVGGSGGGGSLASTLVRGRSRGRR